MNIASLKQQMSTVSFSRQEKIMYALVAVWALLMISLPIQRWTIGDSAIPTAVSVALAAQFIAVTNVLGLHLGWQKTATWFVIVAFLTWGAEFIGSTTGFPFGEYSYTDTLQPQIAHVPLLIPIAWFIMLAPAWAVAQIIAPRGNPIVYVIISALAMTAWDLFLDPQMVEWGFWIWANPEGYFGIPWSNYFGWLLTAGVVTAIIRPYRVTLPQTPLLVIYCVVWFLQTVGQAVFWGQPGPALVGGVTMGSLMCLAIFKLRFAGNGGQNVSA